MFCHNPITQNLFLRCGRSSKDRCYAIQLQLHFELQPQFDQHTD